LQKPICKSKTLDGRNIIIVKAKHTYEKKKYIFAFIEKFKPQDIGDFGLYSIINTLNLLKENRQKKFAYQSSSDKEHDYVCEIYSFITAEMANEFFAQRPSS
jgi:hypothetical protein